MEEGGSGDGADEMNSVVVGFCLLSRFLLLIFIEETPGEGSFAKQLFEAN